MSKQPIVPQDASVEDDPPVGPAGYETVENGEEIKIGDIDPPFPIIVSRGRQFFIF
jgi:hypothetical protein